MMKTTKKAPPAFAPLKTAWSVAATVAVGSPPAKDPEWEVRPCGMLVQKRTPTPTPLQRRQRWRRLSPSASASSTAPPAMRSTLAARELKKLLSERTGLHPQDQKLVFKGKERDSAAFLDIAGVKDRSKVVLTEDPAAQARRVLEMRRTASMEKAARAVSHVSLGVDKLAAKVDRRRRCS
ncbi:unnamed protein product [Spirodela intermedia]|uniref:Ubiquitin-like domain-containing protein n=1 Tax=Spirodela intermedia TaxID=51605 RepID=A0A7I8J9T6_SPIIN|nr:unnamed protein product [Spirodela intermedia]CAA6666864.1 unnamed protein product [Spirodela intermedia]